MGNAIHWKDLPARDKVQISCAVFLILAGVTIAFTSFLWIKVIESGVLLFVANCFVMSGALFGITVYVNERLQLFTMKANEALSKEEIARSN